MEYKFEGKQIVIKTSELFKSDKEPESLGVDKNYYPTGFYIFAYNEDKNLKQGDVFDKDKDSYTDDNTKIGLRYKGNPVLYNSNDSTVPKATLLVDTQTCVNLGESRGGNFTNKLLYRKYKTGEESQIQTGTYEVTLNG